MKATTLVTQRFRDRAVYSDDMVYRYEFQRRWAPTIDPTLDTLVWLLLNPATGDTDGKPRPTLRKCVTFSHHWGYASLTIINLFAFRATDPKSLKAARDPIGPDNDGTIDRVCVSAPRVIAAWGGGGVLLGRGLAVARRLDEIDCLGMTTKGQPRHPLYVPAATDLERFSPDGLLR